MKRRFFSFLIAAAGFAFFMKRLNSPKKNNSPHFPNDYPVLANSSFVGRNISPQELPLEYQEWLNPDVPLPKQISFIPTKLGLGSLIFFLLGTLVFLILGSNSLYMSFDIVFQEGGGVSQTGIAIFFALIGLVLFILGIFNFKILLDEFEMFREKRQDRFRYGIFLNPNIMLIYLSNESINFISKGKLGSYQSHKICHLIPRRLIKYIEIKSRLTPRPGLGSISIRDEIIISLKSTYLDDHGSCDPISFSANALTIPGHELVKNLEQWSDVGYLKITGT